jgi:hypothetical protein
MSEYYTKFCFTYPLPNAEARQQALQLAQLGTRIHRQEESPEAFPAELREQLDCWGFEAEAGEEDNHSICLRSREGGVDAACAFIQHLIRKHDPNGRFGFQWCHDSDQAAPDGYGGGAAIITAEAIEFVNTGGWLHRQLKRIVTVRRLCLRLEIDQGKDRDKEVHRLLDRINEILQEELPGHDVMLINHPDETEIEEHENN